MPDTYDPAQPAEFHNPSVAARQALPSAGKVGVEHSLTSGDEPGSRLSDLFLQSNIADRGHPIGMNSSKRAQQSQPGPSRKPPARPPPNPAPRVFPAPPQSPDSGHRPSPISPGIHGPPPQYPQHPASYGQMSGYAGQYTVSPSPPISMGHPAAHYSFPPGYNSAIHGASDPNMLTPQNVSGYQAMMQPPLYHYQRHSPEGATAHPTPYATPTNHAMYAHGNPSPSPQSPMPSHPLNMGASYPGQATTPFGSHMPSPPMGGPQFGYPPHSSPMYQGHQYGPSPYAQQFPGEQEGQGTWWYVPSGGAHPNRPYEGIQSQYQGHYPMYPQMGHRSESETTFSPSGSSVTSPTSSPSPFLRSPSHQPLYARAPLSDSQLSSSSTLVTAPPASTANPSAAPPRPPPADSRPDKVPVRRPYHPNSPAQRSEWVMWAGNVPSDATREELWNFFSRPPPSAFGPADASQEGSSSDSENNGVLSVFLIARSNCAFINFDSEDALRKAIARFNNVPLRSDDPRCPNLVCRVRSKDDDLKAGVGGQRGMGIHMRWVKDQKDKAKEEQQQQQRVESMSADSLAARAARMSVGSEDDLHRAVKGSSSSSGSYASTNSSVLTRYFPQRYFILKSLSQFDLDLSVEKGLWATQKHNEGVLDLAYRTSKDVFLIFGVNKSGEFYGYARMAGPVLRGEQKVSWATRTAESSPGSSASLSSPATRSSIQSETIPEEPESPTHPPAHAKGGMLFSPGQHRQVAKSPLPMSPGNTPAVRKPPRNRSSLMATHEREHQSAPPELGAPRHKLTMQTPQTRHFTDIMQPGELERSESERAEFFHLDEDAPSRAVRSHQDEAGPSSASLPKMPHSDGKAPEGEEQGDAREEGWGESFKIEWVCTKRLPFFQTRHLRNPWNHEREVKVSRDGTELEPSVGQRLLDEWERLAAEASSPQANVGTIARSASSPAKRPSAGPSKTTPAPPAAARIPRTVRD